jgi:hypothetical protein
MKSEKIIRAEYVVRIVTPKDTPEMNLRRGRQFTPAINRAIGEAIQRTAGRVLRRYISAGKLDKSFRLDR